MTENNETFLVSRSKLFCEGLKRALRGSQFEVVGVADDVGQTESKIREAQTPTPRVVLIDLSSQSDDVSDNLTRVRSVVPDARIVVLAGTLDSETLVACFAAGAQGFLTRDISADALLQSLRLVMLGESVFPANLVTFFLNGMASTASERIATTNSHGLSEREVQILQCLVQGDSNKMIANRLNITEATIKVHMRSLTRKIKVINRTQAAVWAHGNLNIP